MEAFSGDVGASKHQIHYLFKKLLRSMNRSADLVEPIGVLEVFWNRNRHSWQGIEVEETSIRDYPALRPASSSSSSGTGTSRGPTGHEATISSVQRDGPMPLQWDWHRSAFEPCQWRRESGVCSFSSPLLLVLTGRRVSAYNETSRPAGSLSFSSRGRLSQKGEVPCR